MDETNGSQLPNLKELCKLIEVAGNSGVIELTVGDIRVKFSGERPKDDVAFSQATSFLAPDTIPPSQARVSGASSIQDPRDVNYGHSQVMLTPEDRAMLEEIESEQLMFDNPVAYEQMNIDRLMGSSVYEEA